MTNCTKCGGLLFDEGEDFKCLNCGKRLAKTGSTRATRPDHEEERESRTRQLMTAQELAMQPPFEKPKPKPQKLTTVERVEEDLTEDDPELEEIGRQIRRSHSARQAARTRQEQKEPAMPMDATARANISRAMKESHARRRAGHTSDVEGGGIPRWRTAAISGRL